MAEDDRARGCYWGQLIGDALGSSFEFKNAETVTAKMKQCLDNSGHLPMLGGGPFRLDRGQVWFTSLSKIGDGRLRNGSIHGRNHDS